VRNHDLVALVVTSSAFAPGIAFFAVHDDLLRRTTTVLKRSCDGHLLVAYLSVM
jgi:hypothetical protein